MTRKRFIEDYNEKDGAFIKDTWLGEKHFIISTPKTLLLMNALHDDYQRIRKKLIEKEKLIDELYQFRLIYNAHLFNQWHKHNEIEVYKSRKHHDGSIPFENDLDDWFIVVAILPDGKQITNHYPLTYWEYFQIPCYKQVKDEFDGHTPKDVLERLTQLIK